MYEQKQKKIEQDKVEYNTLKKIVNELVSEAKRRKGKDFERKINQTFKTNNRVFWKKAKLLREGKKKQLRGVRNRNNEFNAETK